MTDRPFIHLRVHSAYSLSEGAIKLSDLVTLCQDLSMPAVAVTDSNNMFGAMEFALAASRAGIQPIVGCQIDLTPQEETSLHQNAFPVHRQRLVLLVQNEEGYRNLVRLSSDAYLDQGEPQTSIDHLEAHSDGLICLSGGPDGAVGCLLAENRQTAAEQICRRLAEIFAGRFYIELQRHGLEVEERIEGGLLELAYELDLPLVATNDVFFATADLHEAHDALLCIAEGVRIGEENRRKVTPKHYFRSTAEMRELFSDLPEAVDNTFVISRRCAYIPRESDPLLPPYEVEEHENEAAALRTMSLAGLGERLRDKGLTEADQDSARPYFERLEYELDVIGKMGFPGYFLIVADIVRWAKQQQIPVGPGRGSGAGSVVAWALTITELDPLHFGLLFERFLNPERVSMPDFDIDFCQDRRDEVIDYVREKYGRERVAQIITFGTFQARAVLRDVGRVLGLPHGQVDRIAKMVPFNPAHPPTLQQAIDGEPELQRLREEEETVAHLVDICLRLEGLYRHASTHAAGVIISGEPLADIVPLYRDERSGKPATQFSMKYAEAAGLVKFDFLGLKTLTVLERTLELLRERDVFVDLAHLPLGDAETYEMLGRGDTTGVFQLESAGMRDTLKRLQPDKFDDIIALISLYRPGPMDNIPRYIACKHGEEEPDYLHPVLRPILEETFGVMIYQEQVMQVARELSGYSLGGADLLRRAMGKKIKSEMDAQRDNFVKGALARNVDRDQASNIFDQVSKFAEYGFNKSHAAAYALVGYQTAYLKTHYPVEFMAASMSLDFENTEKLNVFRQELDRLNIPLLPPDINVSDANFSVEETADGRLAIRYALAAIRNVGKQAMQTIVGVRKRDGHFGSMSELASRLHADAPNKREFEALVCAGAFDRLDNRRRCLFEGSEQFIKLAASIAEENEARLGGQNSLLEMLDNPSAGNARLRLPRVPEWSAMERLTREFDVVGSFLSSHPLESCKTELERLNVFPAASFNPSMSGRTLKVAGVVTAVQQRLSSKKQQVRVCPAVRQLGPVRGGRIRGTTVCFSRQADSRQQVAVDRDSTW